MLCKQGNEIGPNFSPRRKSHDFSLFASGTCGIFSSFGGDGKSNRVFVQRSLDTCLVMMDTSGIKTRLGTTMRTLLEMRRETEGHSLVGTVIFGFLTLFKKGQASSTFEALNSVCLSSCQTDVRPLFEMR